MKPEEDGDSLASSDLHNAPLYYSPTPLDLKAEAGSSSSSASSSWSNAWSGTTDASSAGTPSSSVDSDWPRVRVPAADKADKTAQIVHDFIAATRNPRRSHGGSAGRARCPPQLVRQTERKVVFVDNLVDLATHMVEAIWPTSSVFCHSESASGAVLPLRTFIQETLRRSRSSYSTLQVALYYLILIKPRLPHRDFTREQSHDSAVLRALQCGRRMFLAALILASKYLQDRNFSARAWSKISGLAVAEINQNERAFLDAVRFELHITEPVYNRWTDVVMKLTPPPPPAPPSPACLSEHSQECDRFRKLILQLRPGLDNAGQVLPRRRRSAVALDDLPAEDFLMIPHKNADQASVSSPASTDASDDSTATAPTTTAAAIAASKQQQQLRRASAVIFVSPPYHPPAPALGILEPMAAPSPVPVPAAPALGLLPTPRLLPQNAGFGTPAVSAVSRMLSRRTAMEAAMAQVSRVNAAQVVDRWPGPVLASSPPAYPMLPRRSSLANSLSTASSPESMISDMSQLSRSSSISSTSGLASAPTSRLDAQARFRPSRLGCERMAGGLRPPVVLEDFEAKLYLAASPETYTGPVGSDANDLALGGGQAGALRKMLLLDGGNSQLGAGAAVPAPEPRVAAGHLTRSGVKRSRPESDETANPLQDSVRDLLRPAMVKSEQRCWPDSVVRPRAAVTSAPASLLQPPVLPYHAAGSGDDDGRSKRPCFSSDSQLLANLSMNGTGPGMWAGILN